MQPEVKETLAVLGGTFLGLPLLHWGECRFLGKKPLFKRHKDWTTRFFLSLYVLAGGGSLGCFYVYFYTDYQWASNAVWEEASILVVNRFIAHQIVGPHTEAAALTVPRETQLVHDVVFFAQALSLAVAIDHKELVISRAVFLATYIYLMVVVSINWKEKIYTKSYPFWVASACLFLSSILLACEAAGMGSQFHLFQHLVSLAFIILIHMPSILRENICAGNGAGSVGAGSTRVRSTLRERRGELAEATSADGLADVRSTGSGAQSGSRSEMSLKTGGLGGPVELESIV